MQWLKKWLGVSDQTLIDDAAWLRMRKHYRFIEQLSPDEIARLRTLANEFIARKSFSGAAGFELTDDVVVAIAAQACLPVVNLGLELFDAFNEIIVYPDEFHVEREIIDDDGIVHDASGALQGETMQGGPVVLSWRDVAAAGDGERYNVVVHEFAHKLDLAHGELADGVPRFHPTLHAGLTRTNWIETLDDAYTSFCDLLDAFEDSFPTTIDPESEAGLALYATLPLDAYASEDPAEFFAVASETYFVAPTRLTQAFPALAEMLDRYYRPRLTT